MHFFQSNFQVKILAFYNRIGSVMVSVVDWSAVDRGFKDYKIGNCCFSALICGATCLSADCYFSELEL